MGAEDFVKLSVRARVDFAMTGTSADAELLFYRGLQYCGLNDTRGVIPTPHLADIGSGLRRPAALAAELVLGEYWERSPIGWCVRNWEKWQHDFDQVAEKRRRDAERKREERRAARDAQMNGGDAA